MIGESPRRRTTETSERRTTVLVAILVAVIGAAATITAAIIGHAQGQKEATPGPTVTVTASPTVTVTETASADGSSGSNATQSNICTAASGCVIRSMAVPLADSGAVIDLATAHITLASFCCHDLIYQTSSDGKPELKADGGGPVSNISLAVTAANKSLQQCTKATNQEPDSNPIVDFHKGLLFCVALGDSGEMALLEETSPLGSSGMLNLTETYWPAASH
jgi:hypothetical protein